MVSSELGMEREALISPLPRAGGDGMKLPQGKLRSDIREKLLTEGGRAQELAPQGRGHSLKPVGVQEAFGDI